MTTLFEEEQHVYCTNFMVTVSHNGNPIVAVSYTHLTLPTIYSV